VSADTKVAAETNGEHDEGRTQNGQTDDGNTETAEEMTNPEVDDDDAEEAIQAGSVDQDGNVVDTEGHVIGKVNGENASQYNGSAVDQQGDILDEEGNVIGQASLDEAVGNAKSEVESKADPVPSEIGSKGDAVPSEVGSKVDEATANKPDLTGPFGVQDNGEVTNATGVPIGKLLDGEPKDLVGTSIKDIDSQGNLVKESGDIVGKVELDQPVDAAPSEIGSKPEDPEAKLDDAGDKIEDPESKLDEAGEKVGDSESKLGEAGESAEDPEAKLDEAGEKVDEAVSVVFFLLYVSLINF